MSGHLTYESITIFAHNQRGNDPDSDPEPPMAPPVIILYAFNGLGFRENQKPGSSDANLWAEPQPPTSLPAQYKPTSNFKGFDFRRKNIKETESEPEPDPEPEPEPDSAPPSSTSNTPPQHHKFSGKMGSKASKLSSKVQGGHSKLQPAVANSDKEQMKEPANYYSHRSKSMRRKAGRNAAGAGPAAVP